MAAPDPKRTLGAYGRRGGSEVRFRQDTELPRFETGCERRRLASYIPTWKKEIWPHSVTSEQIVPICDIVQMIS